MAARQSTSPEQKPGDPDGPRVIQGLPPAEAALRLDIPGHHLYYWKKTGLLGGGLALSFDDLLKARFIYACRQRGISLQRIRRIVSREGDWYARLTLHSTDALLERSPGPGGESLRQPETGQLFFVFPADGGDSGAGGAPLLHLERERLRRAEREAERAAREAGLERPELAEQLVAAEERYLRELETGDFRRIKRSLEEILRLKPDHLAARIEFGNLCFEFRRYDRALELYEEALEMDPDCVEALYNVANIHFREERYAVSIRYFQRCIQLDPEFPEAYYNLALLYLSLQYLDYARGCFERYLELDPDSDWATQARGALAEIEGRLQQESNFSLFPLPLRSP